ncbi:MAG: DMT family transporter [Methanobacteriota archaeon]|nr:MAG: DMT family transporter [Euryarchaeota archaeon]
MKDSADFGATEEAEPLKISKNIAYALMAIAAVAWATSGTLTVLAIDEGATANIIALWSEIFSAAIFFTIICLLDRPSLLIRRDDLLPFLLFSTITGALFSVAWYHCIDLTSITTAVILLCSYPSIVTVASIFLLGEKMTAAKAVALPITFIGCVLVSEAYDLSAVKLNALGIVLGVFTAFGAAAYYIFGKKFLKRYTPNTVALYFSALMLPTLLVITDPGKSLLPSLSPTAWFIVLLIALIPCTFGFFISMVALKRIEASKASIVASIEPAAAVALAVVIVSEAIAGLQLVGVALVIGGVMILRVVRREDRDAPVEAPVKR